MGNKIDESNKYKVHEVNNQKTMLKCIPEQIFASIIVYVII